MGLDSAVADSGFGVAVGVVAWPEQAAKIMRSGTSAQIRSLVIRILLSFSMDTWARLHIHSESA